MYLAYLGIKLLINLAQNAQIALLLAKKISVFKEYADFLNVFFKKSTVVLPNCLDINKYIIKSEPGKQPSYKPIYSLDLIELEILKTYIRTNLINGFIQPFKSLTKASILFV